MSRWLATYGFFCLLLGVTQYNASAGNQSTVYLPMSNSPKWYFEPTISDDSPSLATAAHFSKYLSAVVREFTQNSLDGKLPENEKPVTIKVSLVSMPKIDNPDLTYFDSTFRGHIDRIDKSKDKDLKKDILNALNKDEEKTRYALVLEDFETIGLRGDVYRVDSAKDEHFQAFMRATGSSESKASGKMGSWGLGKATLWYAGASKSIFVYSVRSEGTPKEVLMGRCILPTVPGLTEGGRNESSNGYWGVKRVQPISTKPKHSQIPVDAYSVPVTGSGEGAELICKFKKDFKLRRGKQSGLSVVIPYYTPNDSFAKSISQIFAEEWALVIVEGGLTVEIYDERSINQPEVVLNNSNISAYKNSFGEKSLARVFDMSELAKGPDVQVLEYKTEHGFSAAAFINKHRSAIMTRVSNCKSQPAMFILDNIPVNTSERTQEYGQLYVMITPNNNSTQRVQLYRDYLRIGGEKGSSAESLRNRQTVGVDLWAHPMLTDKSGLNPVAALIRDGELPSHTDVKPKKADANFEREKRDVRAWNFIKNLPAQMAKALDYGSAGKDFTAFAEIFPAGNEGTAPQTLCISTDRLLKGEVNAQYRTRVRGSGGETPYEWSVSFKDPNHSGSIHKENGTLTVPLQSEEVAINLTVSLRDKNGLSVSKDFIVDFKNKPVQPNEAQDFTIAKTSSGADITINGIPSGWATGCKVTFGYRRDGLTVGNSLSAASYADLGNNAIVNGNNGVTTQCRASEGEVDIKWTMNPTGQVVVNVTGVSFDTNRELIAKLEELKS